MTWVRSVAVTGTCSGDTVGTVRGGTALPTNQVKAGSLSCLASYTMATSTATMSTLWQVSDDNSTWTTLSSSPQNAANVAQATGTAAIVTRAVPAPGGWRGWKFIRPACVTGVTGGTTGDVYSLTSYYERGSAFDGG